MLTTRTFALASALLLAPFGWGYAQGIWDDPQEYHEYGSRVAAYVQNVTFADPPNRYVFDEWNLTEEQLVEGHTTFVTIERSPIAEVKPGEWNITGFLRCEFVAEGEHSFLLGVVPVPTRVERAGVECENGARVIVKPGTSLASAEGPMAPTGRLLEIRTPHGMRSYAEEFVYTVTEEQPDGTFVARDRYAWSAPVFPPWADADGSVRNFWMPIPADRVDEMGVADFEVIPEVSLVG